MMAFDSFEAAWQMAGHGPYVWGAYALTFALLCYLVVSPVLQMRQIRRQITAQWRRQGSTDLAVAEPGDAKPAAANSAGASNAP